MRRNDLAGANLLELLRGMCMAPTLGDPILGGGTFPHFHGVA